MVATFKVAGYWHDVIDCYMVPYDAGDHFCAKFFILPHYDASSRFLLIGDRLENCYLATSNLYNFPFNLQII